MLQVESAYDTNAAAADAAAGSSEGLGRSASCTEMAGQTVAEAPAANGTAVATSAGEESQPCASTELCAAASDSSVVRDGEICSEALVASMLLRNAKQRPSADTVSTKSFFATASLDGEGDQTLCSLPYDMPLHRLAIASLVGTQWPLPNIL